MRWCNLFLHLGNGICVTEKIAETKVSVSPEIVPMLGVPFAPLQVKDGSALVVSFFLNENWKTPEVI